MPAEAVVLLGVAGAVGNLINLTVTTIFRAKSLAAFVKSSLRNSLEAFLALLRNIESTYDTTLAILHSLPGIHRQQSSKLAGNFNQCLRICRQHSNEIDDQLVLILLSRWRAWTAKRAESHLERHRIALEAAKMDLSLCMATIR